MSRYLIFCLNKFLKATLAFIISLQIVILPNLSIASSVPQQHLDNAQEASNPIGEESAKQLSEILSRPEEKNHLNFFYETSEALQDGTLQIDTSKINNLKLRGQRVDLFHKGRYVRSVDLTNPLEALPQFSVSQESLRIAYDSQRKELAFEYVVGMKADQTGGQIQARHVIPEIDMATFAIDPVKKHLYILEKNGQLHAAHGGFYLGNLFKNPIPVVTKIYEFTNPNHPIFQAQSVRSYILNSGVRPFSEEMLDESSVIKKNKYGQEILESRDLYIEYTDASGRPRVLGVFSHRSTEHILKDNARFLIQLVAEYNPSEEANKMYEEMLEGAEKLEREVLDTNRAENPIIEQFIKRIDPKSVESMFSSVQAMGFDNGEIKPQFSLEEWRQDYQEILNNFAKQKGISPTDALANEYQREIQTTWFNYVTPVERTKIIEEDPFEKLSRLIYNTIDFRKTAAAMLATGSVYFSYPFVHDAAFGERKIFLLNWIYEHMYSPALKDALYRSEVLESMAYLLFLWPLVFGISLGFEKFVDYGHKKYGQSDSKLGVFFRSLKQNWGGLGHWQRIISAGMRLYATIVYPALRFSIETVLRQKDFASAYDAGLNPRQKVKVESKLGQRMGLEKDFHVGYNSPFERGIESSQVRQKIQTELKNQKSKATALAWVLATVVVSRTEGIDLATLQMIAERKISIDKLNEILKDPRLKLEWEILSKKIYEDLKRNTNNLDRDISEIDLLELRDFYDHVKEIALKIKEKRGYQLTLTKLWNQSKNIASDFMRFMLTNGYKEAQFYRRMYVGDYVTQQTFKEATVDIPFTILTMGLIGERANLEAPKDLSAQAGQFMNTHPEHRYEIKYNYQGHWISNAARQAIVYQALDNGERHPEFESYYKFRYRPNQRHQGVVSAAKDWVNAFAPWNGLTEGAKHVPHPNLYENSWAGFKNGFATIQAKLTVSILGRLAIIPGMTFGYAFMSYAFSFFATQATYSIFMDIMQTGNASLEIQARMMNDHFDKTILKIKAAAKEQDQEESRKMFEEGYKEMIELYNQSNKQALKGLEKTFSQTAFSDIFRELKKSKQTQEYYGLVASLIVAINNRNTPEITKYKKILEGVLSKAHNVPEHEISKLNAEGILNFAMSASPIYFLNSYHTSKHNLESSVPILTWSTVTFWVVFSAWFYSGIARDMFDPNKITLENISLFWVPLVLFGYLGMKLIMGRSSWEFYLDPAEKIKSFIRQTKVQFQKRSEVEARAVREKKNKEDFMSHACAALFAPKLFR